MFGRVRDPVCGAKVKKTTQHRSQWNGQQFYFDCAACKTTFEQDPGRYVSGREKKGFLGKLSEASDGLPKSCHEMNK